MRRPLAAEAQMQRDLVAYWYQLIANYLVTDSLKVTDMCATAPDLVWFGLLLLLFLQAAPFFFHEPAPSQ